MENIARSATEDSPEVSFNEVNKTLKITGNSYPENCETIYVPLTNFIDKYNVENNKILNLYFYYNLINSTSTMYIARIITRISELVKEGLVVTIKWCYDENDEELMDLGEKLSSISKLPFEFVPIVEED